MKQSGFKQFLSAVIILCILLIQPGCMTIPEKVYFHTLPTKEISQTEFSEFVREMPKISTTKKGRDADPVNLIFISSYEDLAVSFKEAGWYEADLLTFGSAIKTIWSAIRNIPYFNAPVSPFYLFSRKEDFAFQKPRFSVRNRHHLRFWMAPYTIEGSNIWIAAATHDIGIEFRRSIRHFAVHKIDPDIDKERDFILGEMLGTEKVHGWHRVKGIGPTENGVNATGGKYFTDGDIVVIYLGSEAVSQIAPAETAAPAGEILPAQDEKLKVREAPEFTVSSLYKSEAPAEPAALVS